jgi:hypothetical protein
MSQTRLLLTACCAVGLTTPHGWAQRPVDVGKKRIEFAAKKLVAETAPAPRPVATDSDDPRVEPGKVKWHDSFADACAAAKKSGKPVLLFQMMGRLDHRFT